MPRPVVYPIPQTVEEAEFYFAAGVAPKRPRNKLEIEARALLWEKKRRGRKVKPGSPTRSALELACYYVQAQGMSRREAAKLASAAYGLKAAHEVLKLLRVKLAGPQVMLRPPKRASFFGGLISQLKAPLVSSVEDVPIEPFKVFVKINHPTT